MKEHRWKFARYSGVTQVVFEKAEDIVRLKDLDQKLWTVLSMPTSGIFFSEETAKILDTDNDAFIRPPEIFAAIDFLDRSLKDISFIMQDGDSINVSDIKDDTLLSSASWLLTKLKSTDKTLRLSDVIEECEILSREEGTAINEDASNEERLKSVVAIFVKDNPESSPSEILEKIEAEKNEYIKWNETLSSFTNGLSLEQMQKALSAFEAIQKKLDDFFIRCSLLDYDESAEESLKNYNEFMKAIATTEIDTESESLKKLPIAIPNRDKIFNLKEKLNPAWRSESETLYADVILQFCGEVYSISENDWKNISSKISEFKNFYKSEANLKISCLDIDFLKEEGINTEKTLSHIEERITFEKEKSNIEDLKKLLLLRRDFFTLLKNYVSFSDFYTSKRSIFQAGIMFFDNREAHLCFKLKTDARHASLDPISGAYLLYCDIFRKNEKQEVLCLLTNGSSDNIMVGQNGIFYDRDGNDWNATITKIVSNPISIREAFAMPYKKLVRLIEEQIAKRASSAEEKSNAMIASIADKSVNAPKEASKSLPNKKIDLGTIALIGTAIGGVSTLVGSILGALFGLGYWVPLGLLGLILFISGPSMMLAAMKLRKRSIGPILEANGWAINALTRVNIPLGTSLTKTASLPKNAKLMAVDPFAEKNTGKRILLVVLFLLLICAGIFCYFYFIKNAGVNPLKWFK